uniref:BTB domain-containing protein n=1 Tax=Mucochytrium quahogii TaxID=96639 RepID=A0A7S2R715_9STRA|mmetsp:Transcript_19909/g.32760  ORF Transcript_19909/g.32760 Transcript_19909/m.32760 type:complete len:1096 (-) Transcript_19909:176-3463(-)|eukprot:CAMPEP_0203745118 /NCGR_PEP_ID=MMETSP0098-20131031/963_1 /ASSEMBLY_ACC=CAM_ASM_000208 /TAXON_ID=96639 /ORGANISM=" , Strain NY0313808BC1" /LENGTH=1095 /DNA_ID=CAMNT_0050632813 /DNA_START=56 /DNA_END=3343 /DNA_ORIENTATION=-
MAAVDDLDQVHLETEEDQDEDDEEEDDEEDDDTASGGGFGGETGRPVVARFKPFLSHGRGWEQVRVNLNGYQCQPPTQRSLHVSLVYHESMYVFGGYDGAGRVNDFHRYDFVNETWHEVVDVVGVRPTPRDRHVGVILQDHMFIFGGYDGLCRTNDLHGYDFVNQRWYEVFKTFHDSPPSARHSHCGVSHRGSMYIFGGYDGAYKNDLYCFTPNFEKASCSGRWTKVTATGRYPQARYRASCVAHGDNMYLFGGHDGSRHLNDVHIFSWTLKSWSSVQLQGPVPLPRDSHAALVYRDCMFVFGGSSGTAMNDFHYLDLETHVWSPVPTDGWFPCSRFCHVAVEYDNSMYIYGGYDGQVRLKDFHRFRFAPSICHVQRSRLVDDLAKNLENETLSDIVFQVENTRVPAHRVFCCRCSNLVKGINDAPRDDQGRAVIKIPSDIKYDVFRKFLAYMYLDKVRITSTDLALQLFPLANMYEVDRLKKICLNYVSSSLTVDNAANVFQASDLHGIQELREGALKFILSRFDEVSRTTAFEDMGRTNVELVFEILRCRGESSNGVEGIPEMSISSSNPTTQDNEDVFVVEKGKQWVPVLVAGSYRGRIDSVGSGAGDTDVQARLEDEGQLTPSKRSLHVTVVYDNAFYVYGGYNGQRRVNDFLKFCLIERKWSHVPVATSSERPPCPRDRHTAVVVGHDFWVFGGYDGVQRVNHLHRYSFKTKCWSKLPTITSTPSARHSHSAVAVGSSMYIFAGYDGSYRNDLFEYDTTKLTWTRVAALGILPSPRYRTTIVTHQRNIYLFGGHDGLRHLNDVHVFNCDTKTWSAVIANGIAPVPRDSHVSVVHGTFMYIFGGSSGNAMNDFYKLKLKDGGSWSKVHTTGMVPSPRFCHAAAIHRKTMYVYGGYDGTQRLNDFIEFSFSEVRLSPISRSSLVHDLASLVGNEECSDITFVVEGREIPAHKVLLTRCDYFAAMFTGGMLESRQDKIHLNDIRYEIFICLLKYLYTDRQDVNLDISMELFVCADRFGVERLKNMCENKMLSSIDTENVCDFFAASESHCPSSLHERCLSFILLNFDVVSKTKSFELMGRHNIDLIFQILQAR